MSITTAILMRNFLARRRYAPQPINNEERMEKSIPITMQSDDLISAARTHGGIPSGVKVKGIEMRNDSKGLPVVTVNFEVDPSQPESVEVIHETAEDDAVPQLPAHHYDMSGVPRMADISQTRSHVGGMDNALRKQVLKVLRGLTAAVENESIKPLEIAHVIHAMQYDGELYPSGEVTTYLRCIGVPGDLTVYNR